ncbi:uncharacterized protein [Panulirus ornatus]|uniref:uncharacterized protein n=1 Tax=Panulirus ornatus TaxID=150431 RepID=UPI003A87C337
MVREGHLNSVRSSWAQQPSPQGPSSNCPRLPKPLSSASRSVIPGASSQGGPFAGLTPQSVRSQQVHGVGQLPLNPRPSFNEHFQPQEGEGFSEDEVALQGGDFSPLFSDEEYVDPSRENTAQGFSSGGPNVPEPQEHFSPSTPLQGTPPQGPRYEGDPQTQESSEVREEFQPQVTTQVHGGSLSQVTTLQQEEPQLQQPPYQPRPSEEQGPEARPPQFQISRAEDQQQQLGRQQYKQETQEILDIVSLPRPIHRTRPRHPRPRPQFDTIQRRPTHPNQLPLYNVIGEDLVPLDSQEAETRERPLQLVYDYEEVLEEEEDEEEEEEPDRLAILLLNSRFNCLGKNNGYYADEEVECEVFHYCQDSVKHSWLCPQGASFHQVHLICMPRSADNICAKSSKFHFVNDYLYKELDGERGANKTYADRYYPEGFEFGVAAVDTTGQVAAAQAPQRPAPGYVDQQPPRKSQQPQYQEDLGDPFVIRRPEQFSRPQQHTGGSQIFARPPPFRGATQGFGNLEEVLAQRRPG